MLKQTVDDVVTVAIVVRDGRGFTQHYEDFVTSLETAQHALGLLAARQTPKPPTEETD